MSDHDPDPVARLDRLWRQSIEEPAAFWRSAAAAIDWVTFPTVVLDDTRAPFYSWFPDGVLNTCFNAVDRHVLAGRGADVALIYDSPMSGVQRCFTFAELRDAVARCAGSLRALGVERGDRVVIYMPMIPETVVAMLACARLGAVHSVVFGGFSARELATRIDDCTPRVIVSASCGLEPGRIVEYKPLLDAALDMTAHAPSHCLIVQRPQAAAELTARDVDWESTLAMAQPAECVPVNATDPLYILYTSGTTGKPKGVVRDNGGHAVALRWSMANVYDAGLGDVFWAASDVGWVVGHSYIVYAPLITGCTSVLYEGKPVGTPDAGSFWRVIAEHRVKALFTAPTAFRAIRKEDPAARLLARHDMSSLRYLFLAGERLDPPTYQWAREKLGVPVVDHWWQTETGWPVAANCMGIAALATKPGSATKAVPGYAVDVLGPDGTATRPGQEGALGIRLPLPPGSLPTLWNDDERFVRSYLSDHPGYYTTGDGGFVDEDGYLYVMGRLDDVINVAGHRLSTGAMEEAVATHPDVAECAVIGVADELKGEVPLGLVTLKTGIVRPDKEIEAEIVHLVREHIGPVAALKRVAVVARLPKTRSGKILRRTIRDLARGLDTEIPPTIEDVAAVDELRRTFIAGSPLT